jgi:hypothetical protein
VLKADPTRNLPLIHLIQRILTSLRYRIEAREIKLGYVCILLPLKASYNHVANLFNERILLSFRAISLGVELLSHAFAPADLTA